MTSPPVSSLKPPMDECNFTESVTEDWKQDEDEDEDEICIDGNLETALDALRGKRDKTLKIVEAVVGERESDVCGLWDVKFWKLKHRVVGLRLEGMEELGYVACMTECDGECEDEGDVENYELFFHDVVLAPRWIKFKKY